MNRKHIFRITAFITLAAILTGCAEKEISPGETAREDQCVETEVEAETERSDEAVLPEEADSVNENPSLPAEISLNGKRVRWAFYSEGLCCYGDDDYCGYLNVKGEEVIPCIYEDAAPFSEGLACVYLDGKYGFIGKGGETVLPFIYDQASSFREGVAYFSRGEEYGFIDREGNVVLELTECESISSFREGLACFSVGGKYGYLDKSGEVVIEPVYDDAGYFYDGLAVIVEGGLKGVIGKDSEEILPPEYTWIQTEDNCIIAEKGEQVSYFDREGNLILEPPFDFVIPVPGRELLVVQNEKQEYGIVDYAGQIRVPFGCYDEIVDPMADRAVVKLGEKYGILRYDGTLEVPVEYDKAALFSDGSTALWTGDEAQLTDGQGNLILAGRFSYISEKGEGYRTSGWTGKDSIWDRQGNLVGRYDNLDPASICRYTNTYYVWDNNQLLLTGQESEACLEEVLLTNQITPKAGAFLEYLNRGSVEGTLGGVGFSSSMANMKQCKKSARLYRAGDGDTLVLYFHAEPWRYSNFSESDSGLYAVGDGGVKQLLGGGESGGSMGGEKACFWYDAKEEKLKPGMCGSHGGFGGRAYSGDVYELKDGEAVLETSFIRCNQTVLNYSEETLVQNAAFFYDDSGEPYTEESILKAEYVTEYRVNEEQVSREAYAAVEERYRCYSP